MSKLYKKYTANKLVEGNINSNIYIGKVGNSALKREYNKRISSQKPDHQDLLKRLEAFSKRDLKASRKA